jgi:hypothetical protein
LDSENCSCPLSQKPVQKRFLPRKGVAFLWKTFLQKIFPVRDKIPLSALAFGCRHALVAEEYKYGPTRKPRKNFKILSAANTLDGLRALTASESALEPSGDLGSECEELSSLSIPVPNCPVADIRSAALSDAGASRELFNSVVAGGRKGARLVGTAASRRGRSKPRRAAR